MPSPSQLFLLADHIKLSLLERQRAISLNLAPDTQDGQISRSLDSLRSGLEELSSECAALEQSGDSTAQSLRSQQRRLQSQYSDLLAQFRGSSSSAAQPDSYSSSSSLTHPNEPSLSPDFAAAKQHPPSTSRLKRPAQTLHSPKSVRFTDTPPAAIPPPDSSSPADAARAALFPYRDDPPADSPADDETATLTNTQLHTYHSRVLAAQDSQLDTLGASIGRQRELSIQIGDELDGQVELLDGVEEGVDRHQRRLDGARKRLGRVGRRAREHWGGVSIAVLICVLVLLIVVLK